MGITNDKIIDRICELICEDNTSLTIRVVSYESFRKLPRWLLQTNTNIIYRVFFNDGFYSNKKFIDVYLKKYQKLAFDYCWAEYNGDICETCDKVILNEKYKVRDCCKLLCYDCIETHDKECKAYPIADAIKDHGNPKACNVCGILNHEGNVKVVHYATGGLRCFPCTEEYGLYKD